MISPAPAAETRGTAMAEPDTTGIAVASDSRLPGAPHEPDAGFHAADCG
jgi:hypothetical protein